MKLVPRPEHRVAGEQRAAPGLEERHVIRRVTRRVDRGEVERRRRARAGRRESSLRAGQPERVHGRAHEPANGIAPGAWSG